MGVENYFKIVKGLKFPKHAEVKISNPLKNAPSYRENAIDDVSVLKQSIYRLEKENHALNEENNSLIKSLSRLNVGYRNRERWIWRLKTSSWSISLAYVYYYFISSGMFGEMLSWQW